MRRRPNNPGRSLERTRRGCRVLLLVGRVVDGSHGHEGSRHRHRALPSVAIFASRALVSLDLLAAGHRLPASRNAAARAARGIVLVMRLPYRLDFAPRCVVPRTFQIASAARSTSSSGDRPPRGARSPLGMPCFGAPASVSGRGSRRGRTIRLDLQRQSRDRGQRAWIRHVTWCLRNAGVARSTSPRAGRVTRSRGREPCSVSVGWGRGRGSDRAARRSMVGAVADVPLRRAVAYARPVYRTVPAGRGHPGPGPRRLRGRRARQVGARAAWAWAGRFGQVGLGVAVMAAGVIARHLGSIPSTSTNGHGVGGVPKVADARDGAGKVSPALRHHPGRPSRAMPSLRRCVAERAASR